MDNFIDLVSDLPLELQQLTLAYSLKEVTELEKRLEEFMDIITFCMRYSQFDIEYSIAETRIGETEKVFILKSPCLPATCESYFRVPRTTTFNDEEDDDLYHLFEFIKRVLKVIRKFTVPVYLLQNRFVEEIISLSRELILYDFTATTQIKDDLKEKIMGIICFNVEPKIITEDVNILGVKEVILHVDESFNLLKEVQQLKKEAVEVQVVLHVSKTFLQTDKFQSLVGLDVPIILNTFLSPILQSDIPQLNQLSKIITLKVWHKDHEQAFQLITNIKPTIFQLVVDAKPAEFSNVKILKRNITRLDIRCEKFFGDFSQIHDIKSSRIRVSLTNMETLNTFPNGLASLEVAVMYQSGRLDLNTFRVPKHLLSFVYREDYPIGLVGAPQRRFNIRGRQKIIENVNTEK